MAAACVANMAPLVRRYYSTSSSTEQGILRAIFLRGIDMAGDAREDQAQRIIIALDDAMSRGGSSAD